jgi:hypothetical protein
MYLSVVYMVRDVMILMQAISIYEGHWNGWAQKSKTFLGLEMATSKATATWGSKK